LSRPLSNGVIASRIETAPRSPTHEMKAVSCRGMLNGSRQSQTATGRAMKIRNSPRPIDTGRMVRNCEGVANRPSTRNMMIWASHDTPSWNRFSTETARMSELPATSPAR
jgi:hypothetical protein